MTIKSSSESYRAAEYYIKRHTESTSPDPNCILATWLKDESLDKKDVVTMSSDMILAGIDTVSQKVA